MDILAYIFLGVLQGIFEWLPISSQGSLMVILHQFLNVPTQLSFNYSIFLHLGTVLSAIVYFRKEVFKIFNFNNLFYFFKFKNLNFNNLDKEKKLPKKQFLFFSIALIFTFLVSGLIYIFFIKKYLFLSKYIIFLIALLLIVTGFLQIFNKKRKYIKEKSVNKLNFKNSIILGLSQGFCVLPGISRSAITTSTLLIQKFNVEDAFKYSFILSIPTIIIGEVGLLILEGASFNILILLSIFTAFIVGYLTIHLLLTLAKKIDFSYICFIIAFIYILVIFI